MTIDEARMALMMLGYPIDASPEPGKFGPVMRQSLIDFQRASSIPDHGMLDEATQNKLKEAIVGKSKPVDEGRFMRYALIGAGVLGAAGVLYLLLRKSSPPMSSGPMAVRYGRYQPEPERPYYTPPELPPPSRMTPVPPAVRFGVG